jgi:hypothetical protein
MRFWVYTHDQNGIVSDVAETETLKHALDEAGTELYRLHLNNDLGWCGVRIIDRQLNDGTTVWFAGPKNLL